MSKKLSPKKHIEKMLISQELDDLEIYQDPQSWKALAPDERELLAILFTMQGEMQLGEGDDGAIQSFALAEKVSPKQPLVIFRQGLAYAKQKDSVASQQKAIEFFEQAISLKQDYIDAWQEWGNTLVQIGKLHSDEEPFRQAQEIYSNTEKLIDSQDFPKLAALYHDWGLALYWQGKLCGEPSDFSQAITFFEKAEKNGCDLAIFWNDFGNAYTEVANLVCKVDYIYEAVTRFMKSVKADDKFFFGWANLGATLNLLYKITEEEMHFKVAHDAFERALSLEADESNIWLRWGELLLNYGKRNGNKQAVEESLLRFEAADKIDPNNSYTLSQWGEACLWIGVRGDNLSLMKDAKVKLAKAIEIEPDESFLYALYGRCLNEFGRYFEDEKYFSDALEHANKGIELNDGDYSLYHVKAMALFGLSDCHKDPRYVEEALKLFEAMSRGEQVPFYSFWTDWAVGHAKIATWAEDRGHAELAKTKYEKSIQLLGDNIDLDTYIHYADILILIGDLDEDCTQYEKAVTYYRKVLEIEPDQHDLRPSIAYALHRIGFLRGELETMKLAVMELEHYLNHETEDGRVWDELGTTLISLALMLDDPARFEEAAGYFINAETKFRHAITLGHSVSYYHMACLSSLKHNKEESFHYLQKAKDHRVLPSVDLLQQDEWLENIRHTEEFMKFIADLAE